MVIPTGLIVTAGIGALAVGAAGNCTGHTVLDGDSLNGRGRAQRDGLLILQALISRGSAIHGVDLEPLR